MLMVCCIAFTTQGLTVNAAIVSGGKKNYSYKETLYLIFDYPYKYYTFKHFEV